MPRLKIAFGLVVAAGSFAQAQVVTTTVSPAPVAGEFRRASQILGSTVQLQGGNYGTVSDIVLDPNGGVSHIVATNNGRHVILPWNAGTMNYDQRVVTYGVTPQALQPLTFTQDAWPTLNGNGTYMTRVQQVFPAGTVIRNGSVIRTAPGQTEVIKVRPNGTIKEKIRNF